MSILVDSYYCVQCGEHIYAVTPPILAARLNNHNRLFHPLYFADWLGTTIVKSTQYSGPGSTRTPHADEIEEAVGIAMVIRPESSGDSMWGNALAAPYITREDRKCLKDLMVKWD